jgi:hypothetical protein
MANEEKIIQDVSKAVDQLTASFTGLSNIIAGNLTKQKELIAYVSELKKAIGQSKELKDFATATAAITQAQTQLSKVQKETADLAKRDEQIKQQQIKTAEAARKAADAETIAQEKLKQAKANTAKTELSLEQAKQRAANQSKEAAGAYQRESDKLRQLTISAKNAAIQYGVNSKEARTLRNEQQQLDRKIKDVDKSLGIHNREVGNYGNAMNKAKGFIGAFGISLGAAQLAVKTFEGIIKNSQAAGDSWNLTMAAATGASEAFFQALGTGEKNLNTIIQKMKEGAKAGREYAAAMDDMFEGGEGARMQIAEIETKIVDAQVKRDVARAKKQREEALKQVDLIAELENQKLAIVTDEGTRLLNIQRKFVEDRTGIDAAAFDSFLKNFRKEESLREEAKAYNTQLENHEKWLRGLRSAHSESSEAVQNAKKNVEDFINSTSESVRIYAAINEKWGGTSDEMIKRTVDAYVAIENAQRDSISGQRRNEVARAKEEELFASDNIKNNGDLIKIKEELLKKIQETSAKTGAEIIMRDKAIESIQREINALKSLKTLLSEEKEEDEIQIPKWINAEIEAQKKTYEARKEASDKHRKLVEEDTKTLQAAQAERDKITADGLNKELELKQEISEKTKELFVTGVNAMFERTAQGYDDDLEKNRQYYDELLANKEMDEEQRSLIEAQRERKENEINKRKRQLEKKQFIFNKMMAIGEVLISLAKANAAALVYGPGAPAIIALNKLSAAFPIGMIAAQTIPMLDKGSENTPGTYIAGEKRPEIRVKNGKAEIVDKPTLFQNDAGAKIIGGDATAKLLNDVSNYTTSQIVNNGKTPTSESKIVAQLVGQMIKEQRSGNDRIVKALSIKPGKTSEIDEMRTQYLRNKLKN